MPSPLAGSIARTIGSAMSGLFLAATLTRDVPAAPGSDPWDPEAPTVATYSCKAINNSYSDYFQKGGLVEANDRKVLILAASLSVTPAQGDRVTIDGLTLTIINLKTDPAKAVWECQARA
jgi:hypothetical protein